MNLNVRINENQQNSTSAEKDIFERESFERLKMELQKAFSVPESDYMSLTAEEIITRNNFKYCHGSS